MKNSIFWFRRDLRLEDNTALYEAVSQSENVIPVFIFDEDITEELPKNDPRIQFIHSKLKEINERLIEHGSSILILKGKTEDVWKNIIHDYAIDGVFINKDYEPYAIKRDKRIEQLLGKNGIKTFSFKDQVIHEEHDVLKADGKPYTVFTPYKNKWLENFTPQNVKPPINYENFHKNTFPFPSLKKIGFKKTEILVRDFNLSDLKNYAEKRDIPSLDATSYLSPHLRFGTISIRQVIEQIGQSSPTFLSELIWREFFMQILFHFPHVVTQNFRSKYDGIKWRNNPVEFEKWCNGETGYPMVDAGMKQLNQTGYMHNRVRMVTASFLCKHLLIDWRLGEAYFAKQLLDFELSSNNGNWQWAAGTGCDAAPYFRVFNPTEQQKKFDKAGAYVKKWLPELNTFNYPEPIVEHKFARLRALDVYKEGLQNQA